MYTGGTARKKGISLSTEVRKRDETQKKTSRSRKGRREPGDLGKYHVKGMGGERKRT